MYERDENTGRIEFSHNPFSMPQGGLEALETRDPLEILAYQYDIVCNGVELSSGAIRNHRPEIMYKAFEIAGYAREEVEAQFGGMLNAFRFGAPPHGGSAPGVDRIVMLLADEPNIREVTLFPMNQQAQDLMMNAPAPCTRRPPPGAVGAGRPAGLTPGPPPRAGRAQRAAGRSRRALTCTRGMVGFSRLGSFPVPDGCPGAGFPLGLRQRDGPHLPGRRCRYRGTVAGRACERLFVIRTSGP